MTHVWLPCALVLVTATAVSAQSTVRRGTPMFFDHDEQSIVVTERYQLCEDVVTDTTCKDIDVVRLQGSLTFQFAVPNWVSNGLHSYAIRAFGDSQYSDPSEPVLTVKVTGKPLPPYNSRTTGPGTAVTPTTAPAPVPLRLTPPD